MPIEATCSCGGRFRAPDKMAGKSVRCPKCSGTFVVPQPLPEPVLVAAAPVAGDTGAVPEKPLEEAPRFGAPNGTERVDSGPKVESPPSPVPTPSSGPGTRDEGPRTGSPPVPPSMEQESKGESVRTPRGLLDVIGSVLPERARGAVAGLALPVFLSYVLLGMASGLGISMVCMFFGDPDGAVEGLIFMMMIVMSLIFMSSVSPVLAVLATSGAAHRANSKLQAGIVAGISAGAGTFAMFVLYGLMLLISFAIFGPSSSGSSSGEKLTEGAGDFGTFVKIVLTTFLPVIFAAFAAGVLFWRAKEA